MRTNFLRAVGRGAVLWAALLLWAVAVSAGPADLRFGYGGGAIGGGFDSTPYEQPSTVAVASYSAGAVLFDGTNDWMLRGADLTGNADGKKGLVSFWIKFQGGDGSEQRFYDTAGTFNNIQREAITNLFRFSFGGAANILAYSNTAYTVASGWVHVLAAWDLATSTFQLYINDVSDLAASPTLLNANIDYTRLDHAIGSSDGGAGSRVNGDIADFYINFAETLDISVAGNRSKFRSGTKPVDLGSTCSTPTGTASIICLKHVTGAAATDFATNRGTGGDFTITGTLTESSTTP